MSEKYKMRLNSSSIMKVPLRFYQDDFTFIVNGEEFKTSRIISDLISPKVSQLHFTDTPIDYFTINTTSKGDFSQILDLVNFETYEFPSKDLPFISEVLQLLGNDLVDILYTGQSEELTLNNIIDLIHMHENPIFNFLHSIEREIEYASEFFYELCESKEEELLNLSFNTIYKILNNDKLILKDEDQLLSFINKLYMKDDSFLTLYETVMFSNVSSEPIEKFLQLIDMNDITNSMWNELSNRLINGQKATQIQNRIRYKDDKSKRLLLLYEDDKKFEGIVRYLRYELKESVDFTSSSVEANYYSPKNVALYDNLYQYFHSKDIENSWICLDFKDHRISPSSYQIKSYPYNQNDQHPKSWVIEVSNDSENWYVVDENVNCSYLNDRSVTHTFKIKNETIHTFRFLRMRLTGPNWLGKNSLAIGSFEVYGTLI